MTGDAADTPPQAVLPDAAYLAALAGVHGLGPRRLGMLLASHPPSEALAVLCGEISPSPVLAAAWPADLWLQLGRSARQRDPAGCHQVCTEFGITVLQCADSSFPPQLAHDHAPPAVLFMRGDPAVLGGRRVGIVGTRNATRTGLDTAHALGEELARHGVVVVSGLARGIDGAAHRGVLAADGVPVGVVANGLDVPYPAQHRALWERVAHDGLLLSEWAPGTQPDAFRFPLRNRLIAALSEVIVVVESRERGGSLSTVREAEARDVQVMAVPGSPRVRASSGTNQLLCDGAAPVTGAADVLVALGLDSQRRGDEVHESRPAPDQLGVDVLEMCRLMPRTLDDLVAELGWPVSRVAMAVARLERDGWLIEAGGWFQVVGAWAGVQPTPGSDPGSDPGESG